MEKRITKDMLIGEILHLDPNMSHTEFLMKYNCKTLNSYFSLHLHPKMIS